jgi:periodic tryptophan protein 2
VLAISPDGATLACVDGQGRMILVGVARRAILAHLNFKQRARCLAWAPRGASSSSLFAAGLEDGTVEVWRAPRLGSETVLSLSPFELVMRAGGHRDTVAHVDWSGDGRFLCTVSHDGTAKVFHVAAATAEGKARTVGAFSAHADRIVACFFAEHDSASTVYTVGRDARMTTWQWMVEDDDDDDRASKSREPGESKGRWKLEGKQTVGTTGQKVKCCEYHRTTRMLVVGFNRGVFALYTMPEMTRLQTLSISRHSISSVAVNGSGEWIAFASAKLGQLLVWEWRSETYVLK